MISTTRFVPRIGFRWIDWPPPPPGDIGHRWLVLANEDPSRNTDAALGFGAHDPGWMGIEPLAGRTYDPMADEPHLFLRFADLSVGETFSYPDLDVTEESLLSFANEFGWLETPERMGGGSAAQGESLGRWQLAVFEMRETLVLYRAALTGDESELRRQIEIDDGDPDRRFARWHRPALLGEEDIFNVQDGLRPELADITAGGDRALVALVAVATEVDRHLRRAFSVSMNLAGGSAGAPLQLDFHPSTLLSALWYQLALYINGASEHRACEFCSSVFQIERRAGPGGRKGRSDRKYCSSKCRKDASRARRG